MGGKGLRGKKQSQRDKFEEGWGGRGSVILEHSSSHNILSFIVQHKGGFDCLKKIKNQILFCVSFLFFCF